MSDTVKKEIRVFPDYCSTGVWFDYGNVEPQSLGISEGLQLALKYWHDTWEFAITRWGDETLTPLVSQRYIDRWNEDGKKLCELMSKENDKFVFIYIP